MAKAVIHSGGNGAQGAKGEQLREQLQHGIRRLGLQLDATTEATLPDNCLRLLKLLQKWSRIYPLVAPGTPQQWLVRHLLDSLALVPYVEAALTRDDAPGPNVQGHWLDVGSGAGFPGLPLALALPQWRGLLLDSRSKPCIFMRQAVLELGIGNLGVQRARIEDLSPAAEHRWPLITARAVAPPPVLLPLLSRLLAPGGRVLLPCGPQSVVAAPADWHYSTRCRLKVPMLAAERWLLVAEKPPPIAPPAAQSVKI